MEIQKIKVEEYDSFLSKNLHTVFHESWWLNSVVEGVPRFRVDFWGIFRDNELQGVMPVLHWDLAKIKIVRPYLTPYLGPAFSQSVYQGKRVSVISKIKDINSQFAKILRRSYHFVAYYPFSPWHVDLQPYKWEGFRVGVKYTYLLDLSVPIEKIWEGFHNTRRRDIRRAERLDPNIVVNDLGSFILLNNKTFKRQGKRLDLELLWRAIFKECSARNQCRIWTAYVNETPVASLFLVWDNEGAYYIGGGINENSQGTMSLLMWEAIKFSKELGLKYFDFEGSDIPTIENYFRKFGGEIKPVYYVQNKIFAIR